jgi:GNAT superfamily N-acetyltransferase
MPNHTKNKSKEHRTLVLDEGTVFSVRTIRPGDVSALQRFFSRCSERSIHLRFSGPMEELTDKQAEYFANIDGVDRFALVALDPDEPDEVIAVARFDRASGSDQAEYAALVEDRWQGRGLGIGLTQQLIDDARDKGVYHFYTLVTHRNASMMRLLRGLGLTERERREGNAKYVEVELQELEQN